MNEIARKKESTPGENLTKQIIEQYNPKSVADMQNALKDIFGPMFEAMLQGEMNSHLGYESNDHGAKSTDNRRNGYTNKKIKTSAGEVDIKVPRDRDSSFEPKLVPKRQKDVSEIEEKVLAMYARGMSQRDIAETIEDIYGLLLTKPRCKTQHLFELFPNFQQLSYFSTFSIKYRQKNHRDSLFRESRIFVRPFFTAPACLHRVQCYPNTFFVLTTIYIKIQR